MECVESRIRGMRQSQCGRVTQRWQWVVMNWVSWLSILFPKLQCFLWIWCASMAIHVRFSHTVQSIWNTGLPGGSRTNTEFEIKKEEREYFLLGPLLYTWRSIQGSFGSIPYVTLKFLINPFYINNCSFVHKPTIPSRHNTLTLLPSTRRRLTPRTGLLPVQQCAHPPLTSPLSS